MQSDTGSQKKIWLAMKPWEKNSLPLTPAYMLHAFPIIVRGLLTYMVMAEKFTELF